VDIAVDAAAVAVLTFLEGDQEDIVVPYRLSFRCSHQAEAGKFPEVEAPYPEEENVTCPLLKILLMDFLPQKINAPISPRSIKVVSNVIKYGDLKSPS
jgi:hypothetical protein